MNLSTFRGLFPEFNGVPDAMVTGWLAQAATSIDVNIWGTKADLGQAYLAAHYLATSPFGQNARMKQVAGIATDPTTYMTNYKRLQREVSTGFRVTS